MPLKRCRGFFLQPSTKRLDKLLPMRQHDLMHELKTFRELNKMSLSALAEQVGVNKATLSRIETGQRAPSLGLAVRLQNITGIPACRFSSIKTEEKS